MEPTRGSRLARLTAPGVLLAFAGCSMAVALGAFVAQYSMHRSMVWHDDVVAGRDFLAFYAAGRIVLEGRGPQLYDLTLQQEVQARLLAPESMDGFLPFVNPAPLAPLYAALAWLPYESAFFAHTAAMALIFLLGLSVLLHHLPALSARRTTVALLGLGWLPMLVTVVSGQNAALSFALLSAAYAATVTGRQGLAGAALGLLLFKPQYALPFAGLLLLRGRFVSVAVFAAVAAGQYLVGAAACGWAWPVRMWAAVTGPFRAGERIANGAKHVSISEALDYSLVQRFAGGEAASWIGPLSSGLALLLGVAGVGLLVWTWRAARPGRRDLAICWALAVPIALLISPHAQYYEIALLLLPVLLVLDHRLVAGGSVTDGERLALVAGYFVLPLHLAAETVGFQPLILVPIAVAAWTLREIRSAREAAPRREAAPGSLAVRAGE